MGDTPDPTPKDAEDVIPVAPDLTPTAGALRAAGYYIDPSIPDSAVAFDVVQDTPAVGV